MNEYETLNDYDYMAIYYDVIYCSGCDNPNEDVKVYFHQGGVTTCITTSSTVTCY